MSLNIVKLHQLIDQWAAEQREEASVPTISAEPAPEPARELPKDKRVVRTRSSGDKVYLLDEVKKTRQHIATPEILKALGFEMGDVGEVEDAEMIKYQSMPAVNRLDVAA